MEKTTDFQQVKKVVVSLLHLPIKPTPLSPAIVSHPIFQSGAYYANNGGSWELIPLLGSEDNLARARNEIESQINDCKTLDRLLALVLLPYQLTFLKYAKPFLSEEDFSRLLAEVWVSSENPNCDANVSTTLAASWFREAKKDVLMTARDYKYYCTLPSEFDVYRGVSVGRNPKGISWTRNFSTAHWFAHRYDTSTEFGYVQCAHIKKSRALAYFNTRGEDEVVVSTRGLKISVLSKEEENTLNDTNNESICPSLCEGD